MTQAAIIPPSPEMGRAHDLLRVGQWQDAWTAYEARLDHPAFAEMQEYRTSVARWQGGAVDNLFVWMEQGAGDRIQMLRYLAAAAGRVGTLWVRDHMQLEGLYSLCSPSSPPNVAWIAPGETRTGYGSSLEWTPALSLPALFQDRWHAPYLRCTVDPQPGLIGLCCFGSRANELDPVRSLPIDTAQRLRNLLLSAGFKVQSLHGADNADRWEAASGETTPANAVNNWRHLADQISACETIITVDTAVAHVAGAMGKTTHLLTYDPSDWRWMTGPASEWYPTIRIHRRPVDADWSAALSSLWAALRSV